MTESANESSQLNELSPARREKASRRFEIILPFLEGLVPLAQLAEKHGKSLRTLRYWISQYRVIGLPGLANQTRCDTGEYRVRDELVTLTKSLAIEAPKLSRAFIQGEVAAEAYKRGWEEPSYRQVRSIIGDMDPQLLKLAHEGTQAHKETYYTITPEMQDRVA